MKMYRMTMDVWVADDAKSPEDWIIQTIDDNLDHRAGEWVEYMTFELVYQSEAESEADVTG